jgi:hypothetical protein
MTILKNLYFNTLALFVSKLLYSTIWSVSFYSKATHQVYTYNPTFYILSSKFIHSNQNT